MSMAPSWWSITVAEEEPVELLACGGFEFGHLLVGHHAHGIVIHVVVVTVHRRPCSAHAFEHALEQLDLGVLDHDDLVGQVLQLLSVGAVVDELGHLDGAFVVRDHLLDELDVGFVRFALGVGGGGVGGLVGAGRGLDDGVVGGLTAGGQNECGGGCGRHGAQRDGGTHGSSSCRMVVVGREARHGRRARRRSRQQDHTLGDRGPRRTKRPPGPRRRALPCRRAPRAAPLGERARVGAEEQHRAGQDRQSGSTQDGHPSTGVRRSRDGRSVDGGGGRDVVGEEGSGRPVVDAVVEVARQHEHVCDQRCRQQRSEQAPSSGHPRHRSPVRRRGPHAGLDPDGRHG
jgi:hypothetical protein